jgi:hypothetical protein
VVIATFRRTFHHDGKISPAQSLSLYLPSRTKLGCTVQLRRQVHSPYFYSTLYVLCDSHSTQNRMAKLRISREQLGKKLVKKHFSGLILPTSYQDLMLESCMYIFELARKCIQRSPYLEHARRRRELSVCAWGAWADLRGIIL